MSILYYFQARNLFKGDNDQYVFELLGVVEIYRVVCRLNLSIGSTGE